MVTPAGPRIGRGDVRLAALTLLAEEPRNGYQIIQEIADRSSGLWRPSPGSVYPALQQLEDEGLVTGDESGGSRTYRLTEEGQRRVNGRAEPWTSVAGSVPDDLVRLRLLWSQMDEAFGHALRVADDVQITEIEELLKRTRRSMFRILAGEAEETGGDE